MFLLTKMINMMHGQIHLKKMYEEPKNKVIKRLGIDRLIIIIFF